METIKIWNDSPSDRQLDEICEKLQEGKILIMPTDTLYGIACDALDTKTVETLCRIKGINPDKTNLSIICSDISMASEYARIDNAGFRLLKEETPGPVTVIFKASGTLPRAFKSRKTVGIRIPDNATARAIAERLGRPILTTSIQYSDEDYAREPSLIAEAYEGKADVMIDAGPGGTIPSAIIDFTGKEPLTVRTRE